MGVSEIKDANRVSQKELEMNKCQSNDYQFSYKRPGEKEYTVVTGLSKDRAVALQRDEVAKNNNHRSFIRQGDSGAWLGVKSIAVGCS